MIVNFYNRNSQFQWCYLDLFLCADHNYSYLFCIKHHNFTKHIPGHSLAEHFLEEFDINILFQYMYKKVRNIGFSYFNLLYVFPCLIKNHDLNLSKNYMPICIPRYMWRVTGAG